MKRSQINYMKYMDGMSLSLNQCTADNIAPYWRDHQSLKGKLPNEPYLTLLGWCSMNYPTTVTDPRLKKHMPQSDKDAEKSKLRNLSL